MDWPNVLTSPAPELIWGLVSRGLGLIFLISFASLWPQVLPIAGSTGIMPIRDALEAIARDFARVQRWRYFPTLLWLDASDRTLRLLVGSGLVAALSVVAGGPHGPYGLLWCYLVYLSLDRPINLVYPWDSLLFEAALWGAFLPASEPLPSLNAVAAPDPTVAWAYRLLVFRVIVGFGKHKFVGSTPQDAGFLKGFFASQPLPTPLGWLAQKLSMPLLKLALFGMFIVELVLPLAVFFPGPWSALAGFGVMGLMVAIWLTGNFGYFNPLAMVLALSWLDSETARRLTLDLLLAPGGQALLHALFVLHTLLWLLAFPFNTFVSFTWHMWPVWLRVRPRFLGWPAALARAFAPLRLAHAYGVFPPYSPPSARITIVLEATWDDASWHELPQRFWPTREDSAPKWCAPHHERFDQGIVYEALGLSEMNIHRNMTGRWDPYGHGGPSFGQVLMHRMLQGDVPGNRFYDRTRERAWGPPRAVRVRTYLLEPRSRAEARNTGKFWRRSLIGPHFPPLRRDNRWLPPLPAPELWHLDDVIWLRRSSLGRLMGRAAVGENAHGLLREQAEGLEARDVALFWDELVPEITPTLRSSWNGLRATVDALRQRYDRPQLHRFERIAGRYAALLLARIEPLFPSPWPPALVVEGTPLLARIQTSHALRLLTYHIVAEGREAYDATMASPGLARDHATRLTMCSGHLFQALFRYETLVYQSQMLRLLAAWTQWQGRPVPTPKQQQALDRARAFEEWWWGKLTVTEFLKTQFTGDEDRLDIEERWPTFTLAPNHEVVRAANHAAVQGS
jgi:hypothetical protein